MKNKYKIESELRPSGVTLYNLYGKVWWLPFWFWLGVEASEQEARRLIAYYRNPTKKQVVYCE